MSLDPSLLAEVGERLVLLGSVASTNDEAKARAADGAVHGTVVAADEQTAGRGRHGSDWVSAPGQGLAFSVVVRPDWEVARWGWIGLAAALAVADVCAQMKLEALVKWPNDVLIGGRKVCGILVEALPGAAVVGIGINVNEDRFPDGIEAISLREAAGRELSREEVLVAVWERMLSVVDREPDLVAEAVWHRLAWRGEVVATAAGVPGRIRGFGPGGELILESRGEWVKLTQAESLRGPGFRD